MANGVLGLVIGVITTLVVDMAFIVQVLSSKLMFIILSNLTFALYPKILVACNLEGNFDVILCITELLKCRLTHRRSCRSD